MKKHLKKVSMALLVCSCLLSGGAIACLSPTTEVKAETSVNIVDDVGISNTVWTVDNGSVTESTSYGGKGAKSIVLAGGETQQSVGANKETTTITTLQEYAEFDLYFDITSYEYIQGASWTSNGAGFRIEFGNGMQLNLPRSGNNSYTQDANAGYPFGNTETGTAYISGITYWAHTAWSNSETKQYKLSVRDEGITLYDLYLPAGNVGFKMLGGNYHSRWYGSHVTDGTQGYGYVKQSGDDYSADYGNISISVLGFTTQQLALSRVEVVPFEETRTDADFATVADGKKDYRADQNVNSDVFITSGVEVTANKGIRLADEDKTTADNAYVETVNAYKNFELIIGVERNYSGGIGAQDFKVDFGNGVSFTCYGSVTSHQPPSYLSYKGTSLVTYNAQSNNYAVRNFNLTGGTYLIKIRVENGVFKYYDFYTNGQMTQMATTHQAWINAGYKPATVNNAALCGSGKIKIYPQQNQGPLIFHSLEVVNLDKAASDVTESESGYENYSKPYTVSLDSANFTASKITGVKLNGNFLPTTAVETVKNGDAVTGLCISGSEMKTLWDNDVTSADIVVYGDTDTAYGTITGWTTPLAVTGDALSAMNISLDGDIGVNFYYNFTDEILMDEQAYVRAIVGTATPVDMLVSEADVDTQGRYVFKVRVAPAQITEKISLQVFKGNGDGGKVRMYSVKDYADYILANSADEKLVNLMKATLNYGGYAQTYFNNNTDNLANAGLYGEGENPVANVTEVSSVNTQSGAATGFQFATCNLYLNSQTTMKLYFTLENGASIEDYVFTLDFNDGEQKSFALLPTADGERFYVTLANVPAALLDTVYTITVKNVKDQSVFTLEISPLAYVSTVLGMEADISLKNLVKALYLYNVAANEYFGK